MKLLTRMTLARQAGCALLLIALSSLVAVSAAAERSQSDATTPVRGDVAAEGKSLTRGATPPDWVEPIEPSQAVDQSALVLRLSDVQIHVDNETAIYTRRMMQANDASMLTAVGKIEITFQPEYQHVDLHALRIIRGTFAIDKTNSAQIRFLQREESLEQGVYTGEVTASVVVDDIRVGDTVDISYTVTGQNPVFGGKFFHSVYWDFLYPTQRKRVILNAPEERPIYYRMFGRDGSQVRPKEQTVRGRRITRFSSDNLPASDFELYTPADVEQFRQIQFSEYKNWQQVAQWADALFTPPSPSTSLGEALNAIGSGSPEQSVQKALRYVQTEIRYLSVSLGENSHRPFPPDVVLARRYGDCKDKALLLTTLLRKLGVDASPVLVSTVYRKGLDKRLPSPLLFDHAIVRATVNGATYFLDATRNTQYGTLASMGQAHAGNDVLIVGGDTDQLSQIPYGTNRPVSYLWTEKAEIDKGGNSATMRVSHRYSGLYAESIRYAVASESKEQLRKLFAASIVRRYPAAQIKGEPTITDDRQANTVTVEMLFHIPGFLSKVDTGWAMRYESSNLRERFYIPENPRRIYPLAIPDYPDASRYEFELKLPDEFDADYKPSDTTVNSSAFAAHETLSFKGHVIKASVELDTLRDRVAPRDVEKFLADIRGLEKMIDTSLTIHRSDLKNAVSPSVLDVPLSQRLTDKQQELIAANTGLLEEAKSAGRNATDAFCERGRAYARLGRKTDALVDINAALKQDPASADLLGCRAEILLFNGDLKSSESDYSRFLAHDTDDGKMHFQRGLAYYLMGKWKEAAADFQHAIEESTDRDDKVRADVMRIFSLRRGKSQEPITPEVGVQDAWPEVALDFAGGDKSEDELLRQVHHSTGDDLDRALSDAYFYLGQSYLLTGNKLKAGVYLQRVVDKGVLDSWLRPAARIQVEQLRK